MFKHSVYLIVIVFVLLGCGTEVEVDGNSDGNGSSPSNSNPSSNTTTGGNGTNDTSSPLLTSSEIGILPTSTYRDSYPVKVHGEANSKVYVNGVEVATTKSNGKATIDLNTSGNYGSSTDFEITLKNDRNQIKEKIEFSVKKEKPKVTRPQAIKLLRQTSFTSYETQIDEVMLNGEDAWITKQLNAVGAHDNPDDDYYGFLEDLIRRKYDVTTEEGKKALENPGEHFNASSPWNIIAFYESILLEKMFEREDQLRQRMALALSEIIVISQEASSGRALVWKSEALVQFYDNLYKNAYGNYRDVLKDTTMSSAMAYYLTYIGSNKATEKTAPDENYARELMQLFSIGVYKLNLDGSKILDEDRNPIPSYTQDDVTELARVFTGWDWASPLNLVGNFYGNLTPNAFNLLHDIQFNTLYHDFGEKNVLGKVIPANMGGKGIEEIDKVIDILMNHPNMAPHVSKHLIMRLVTSNPTPAYIARVATVFNDNGHGVKGDLKATVEAIIRDDEARGINEPENFGKVDTYLLGFTHFSSRLNVKSLKGDKKYSFKLWKGKVSELPMTAPTVFNFYTNEDRPNDVYFKENNLVAPEMTVRTDARLKMFMNVTGLETYDVYAMVELKRGARGGHVATTWEEFVAMVGPEAGLQWDLRDIYEEFIPGHSHWMQKIGTESRPIYRWVMTQAEPSHAEKKIRLEKLYDLLAIKFLGKKLPDEYRDAMVKHNHNTANPADMVQYAIRQIVNSSLFMVLD